MDLRKLKTLIDLVAESDISELEVTEGDGKVRIVKTPPAPEQPVVYAAPPAETAVVAPAAAPAAGADAAPAAEPAEEQYDGHTVLAPMVGRSEEHTSELQSRGHLVCRLLLEKKKIQSTC